MADAAKVLRDGLAAFNNKDLTTAERLFKRVIKADPSNAAALNLITVTMMATGRFAEAQPYIERATSINPSSDVSFYNYGIILKHLNSPRQALEKFTKALALNPNVAATWNNRGATYNDLGEHHAALRDFDKAISLNRAYAEAYTNLGNTLVMLKRSLDAVVAYQKALSINPRLAEALFGLGNSFYDLNRYDEAFHAYDGAFSINPHLSDVEGARLHTKMRLCDWNALEVDLNRLTASIRSGKPVCGPFALLSLTDSPEDHLSCARAWTTKRHPSASKPMARGGPLHHEKIRLAYVSTDFREHATAHLISELFESHDKTRFELFAYSLGPDDSSKVRARIVSAFNHFVSCEDRTDADVARIIADAEIDILVDLNGFTKGARTNILAHRPAPIQVNYLGYPGTMAAPYIDYIVGDASILTAADHAAYSEKLIVLPNSYQPNDRMRQIASSAIARSDFGLPEEQFVFCCFNNGFKILPATFARWMRILKAVEGSVLWLLADNQTAMQNLRKEAEARGVEPTRLVFASRMKPAEHLARHRLADLFLDTLPYNAHTTASDALWAGLPVLTQHGKTFAGRVAASLLIAVGLPELITRTSEEYESLAVQLATNPDRPASIRAKLASGRATAPLFDTESYANHIEAAYRSMYDRYQAGLLPDHILMHA
ncbi:MULTISPECIES: tetratricopeptide repeat protein [unclassified Bradyrhizobium]|uniref:O-linked N-acetylglucosamine transferase, SPINDLY family protein n=1 Tax=unclassified Bradyrhizobium TaxID=2631580 RepID=UPI002478EC3C|nr:MULTISPECIES: tetratricopeptide repeat protein [unclassified Bradyrhizobium]WGS22666.1 tetratricopeptide repeat protein [Bradyrhizobium sp. ISRA463]WGS29654.1 tetratricopeptide repeat protein [Bradyrhizobium sp. ISRA464]